MVFGGQFSLASHGTAFTKLCFGIVTLAITEEQLFEIHYYTYHGNVTCITLSLFIRSHRENVLQVSIPETVICLPPW